MTDERTDPTGATHALALGDGHWIDWCTASGNDDTRVGVIVWHVLPPGAPDHLGNGMCASGVAWAPNAWEREHPEQAINRARWMLHGAPDEHLTLSPSLLCSCGDHGWVKEGRWQRA